MPSQWGMTTVPQPPSWTKQLWGKRRPLGHSPEPDFGALYVAVYDGSKKPTDCSVGFGFLMRNVA